MNQGILLAYVKSCASGSLGATDCGPIWQLGVIVTLLLAAVVTLAWLQLRRPPAEKA
jgi:hypothetical protein